MNKTCGELNGRWSVMFKVAMVLSPIIVSLQTWVVFQVWNLTQFQTVMETIDPQSTKDRVAALELEAARHGWNGEG